MAAFYDQCNDVRRLIAQINDLSRPSSAEFARGQPAWSDHIGMLWAC